MSQTYVYEPDAELADNYRLLVESGARGQKELADEIENTAGVKPLADWIREQKWDAPKKLGTSLPVYDPHGAVDLVEQVDPPAKNASQKDWADYAIQHRGLDPVRAAEMSRDELRDEYSA